MEGFPPLPIVLTITALIVLPPPLKWGIGIEKRSFINVYIPPSTFFANSSTACIRSLRMPTIFSNAFHFLHYTRLFTINIYERPDYNEMQPIIKLFFDFSYHVDYVIDIGQF